MKTNMKSQKSFIRSDQHVMLYSCDQTLIDMMEGVWAEGTISNKKTL